MQGAGLNASNIDQVDLISRAMQANAAIYAKNLNVVAGANQVDHPTLAATPIQGDGAAPGMAINVSQLGGMYADRILLVSNEHGVGVANAGTIAAQSGDLTLRSTGQLVLTGKTNATGNLAITAQDGIQNSGTTELQAPIGQTGHAIYAGLDYGRVWGPQPVALVGTQLAGAAIGIKGSVGTPFGAHAYDLFAGMPI